MGTSTSAILHVMTLGTPPGPATGLSTSAIATNSLTLMWTAPATGDTPFTYQPQQSLNVSPPVWTNVVGSPVGTNVAITGLAAGTAYLFRVITANADTSTQSTSAQVSATTLFVLPGAPTGLALASSPTTATTVSLLWTPPTGTPPFTYLLEWSLQGANTWSSTNTTVSGATGQVTGLTPSTAYDFRVTASNPRGAGPHSSTFSATTQAAATAVTWRQPLASPTISFSVDLLTATAGGTAAPFSQPQSCVSTTGVTLGNRSFEITLSALTQNAGVGLCNPSFVNGTAGGLGINANGIGYNPTTGQNSQPALTAFYNGSTILSPVGTLPGDTAGATITGCLNRDLGLLWLTDPAMRAAFGPNAWNLSATANPATGVGGIEIGQVITPGVGTITGPDGTLWTITAGGQVAVNGAVDGTTSNVTKMVAVGGVIWQENTALNWYFKHIPSDAWSAATTTAPSFLTGQLFLCFDTAEAGAVAILNPGTSAYSYAVPAAFPAWNGSAPIFAVPGQVIGLTAGTSTTTSVPLSWAQLTVGTQPFTYSVQWSLQGANSWTTFGTTQTTSMVVSGLSPATAYSFRVFANNVTGTAGAVSSPAVNAATAATSQTQSIAITHVSDQTVGIAYPVSGTLAGYTTPPTLQYQDNGTGSWLAFPSGSTVSASAFSFTHPAVSTVTPAMTLTVRDANTTTTVSPTSNTFAVNAPVTGTRDWSRNPGGDGSFWVTPFQVGANWITSGPLITALRGGNGGSVNLRGNFSVPWVRGVASDPLVRVTDGVKSINVRIPLGTVVEQPTPGDGNIGGADSTQPYLVWSIQSATINTGSVAASGSVITGSNMCINDGSGPVMMDIVTGEPGSNNSLGSAILDYDLTQANANPNYVIQHMLQYTLDPSFQVGTTGPIWPLKVIDTSIVGPGPIPQGYTIGIPASDIRPAGQTRAYYLLYDSFKQNGGFFYNVGGGGGTNIQVYSTDPANAALVNDVVASWPIVMQRMCLLDATNGVSGSQYSTATIKGMIGGVRNDAFPPPPLLDYTPTGGSPPTSAQIAAFGAWYNTSPVYTTPWVANVPGKHISVTDGGSQTAGVAFTEAGTLAGYSAAPTLQYQDNGTSGSWLALPSGATVTATSFSFTHPAMSVNASATVSVRDANATTTVATSASFSVVAAGTNVPGPPTNVGTTALSNTSLSVTFSPPTTGGVIDHGGYQIAYKKASDPTYTNGPFIPVITAGSGSFTDLQSNVWTITASGQIAVNGIVDGTTANVIITFLVGSTVWQENTALNWYSKTLPGGTWIGPLAAPLPLSGVNVTGLIAATAYNIKVNAANSAGAGAFSAPINVTTASAAQTGVFSVSGGKIMRNGVIDVRRGVCNYIIDPVSANPQTVDFATINSVFPGINCLKACLSQHHTSSDVMSIVNDWTGHGCVVILANYIYGAQQSVDSGNFAADAAMFSDFGNAFKNNPLVWFCSMNEPRGDGNSTLDADHQNVYNAVRGAGNNNIILFDMWGGNPVTSGDGFSHENPAVYTGMTNIVWDHHPYGSVASVLVTIVNAYKNWTHSADGQIPVFWGEWGDAGPGSGGPHDQPDAQICKDICNSCAGTASPGVAGQTAWIYDNFGQFGGDCLQSGNAIFQQPDGYGQTVANSIANPNLVQ